MITRLRLGLTKLRLRFARLRLLLTRRCLFGASLWLLLARLGLSLARLRVLIVRLWIAGLLPFAALWVERRGKIRCFGNRLVGNFGLSGHVFSRLTDVDQRVGVILICLSDLIRVNRRLLGRIGL